MFRVRFHGRGGQGIKTASRLLGTAFFREGFEVQDAPRYGAERRGAPIFAYVRAAREPIQERGIIGNPDLVVVADDTLVTVPAAGVLQGLSPQTVVLISTVESRDEWRHRLNVEGPIFTLPQTAEIEDPLERRYVGAACAGAAARLVGVVSREALTQAISQELGELGEQVVKRNLETAIEAFDAIAEHAGCVTEGSAVSAKEYNLPGWVQLPFEEVRLSAPDIHGGATSVLVKTGLWRTMRPVIDYDRCNRCWWVCSSLCPDSAIDLNDQGYPDIDYDHCKGCLICVAQCPPHAIAAIPEHEAQAAEETAS